MRVTILLDVWPSGYLSTCAIQPPGVFMPNIAPKVDGVRRYRVEVEVDDPYRVDAVVPGLAAEESAPKAKEGSDG